MYDVYLPSTQLETRSLSVNIIGPNGASEEPKVVIIKATGERSGLFVYSTPCKQEIRVNFQGVAMTRTVVASIGVEWMSLVVVGRSKPPGNLGADLCRYTMDKRPMSLRIAITEA